MTFYIQIEDGDGRAGKQKMPDAWLPWHNCQEHPKDQDRPTDQDIGMIARRHIQNRGGIDFGQFYTFTIYSYSERTPTWPGGAPMRCKALTMTAEKERTP